MESRIISLIVVALLACILVMLALGYAGDRHEADVAAYQRCLDNIPEGYFANYCAR